MNAGTVVGIVTGVVILLFLLILSIIAWELFRRDFK